MESNNQIETTEKGVECDSNLNDRDHSPDELQTIVDKIPVKNFLPYFTRTDDISLVNLASDNPQYIPVVQEIFVKRYARKYFRIDAESDIHPNKYFALFSLFGDNIHAIQANGIQHMDANHWLVEMLNKHAPNLEKLCFKKCLFTNIDNFLSQHIKIKHLIFRGGTCQRKTYRIQLPEYRNLKSLELINFSHISKNSLEQVIVNNPKMERLIFSFSDKYFTLSNVTKLIYTHIKQLKDLQIIDSYEFGIDIASGRYMTFVSSSTSMDLFGMTPVEDIYYFGRYILQRVSSDCELITHLWLENYRGRFDKRMIEAVCWFDQIEKLSLSYEYHPEQLEVLLENLPNLRCLSISHVTHRSNTQIFAILRKCHRLERFTVESDFASARYNDDDSIYEKNSSFHEEFIKSVPNAQIKLEFKEYDDIVGIVTKEDIVWRNKLLHWVGYDPIHSRSNLKLLDLATIPEGANVKHKQPLNLIFNYLDLNSLYSFAMASKESKQLVHNYIYLRCKQSSKKRPKQRSLVREKFYLTDEFGINYDGLCMFGKSIKYLEVNLLYYNDHNLLREIEKNCKNLTTLCFRTRFRTDPHDFILPQIRHFIFYGYGLGKEYLFHCDMSRLSENCPNLEIFEIRTVAKLYIGTWKKQKMSFQNLQKIKFKPYDDSQVEYAKELFKDSETEIIIDR